MTWSLYGDGSKDGDHKMVKAMIHVHRPRPWKNLAKHAFKDDLKPRKTCICPVRFRHFLDEICDENLKFSMKNPIVSVFHKESVSDGLDAQNLAGSAVSAKNQFSEQIFGLV